MRIGCLVLFSSAFCLAVGVLPAAAGSEWPLHQHHDRQWHIVHHAIYELQNRIALLEAVPEIVDAPAKGRSISADRAAVRCLDATLEPPRWPWAVACCYTPKPIRLSWGHRKRTR